METFLKSSTLNVSPAKKIPVISKKSDFLIKEQLINDLNEVSNCAQLV